MTTGRVRYGGDIAPDPARREGVQVTGDCRLVQGLQEGGVCSGNTHYHLHMVWCSRLEPDLGLSVARGGDMTATFTN